MEYKTILSKGKEIIAIIARLYRTNDDLDFPTFAMNHLVDELTGEKAGYPVWCENIRDLRHHYASVLSKYSDAQA